jgi:hypothetical protein
MKEFFFHTYIRIKHNLVNEYETLIIICTELLLSYFFPKPNIIRVKKKNVAPIQKTKTVL